MHREPGDPEVRLREGGDAGGPPGHHGRDPDPRERRPVQGGAGRLLNEGGVHDRRDRAHGPGAPHEYPRGVLFPESEEKVPPHLSGRAAEPDGPVRAPGGGGGPPHAAVQRGAGEGDPGGPDPVALVTPQVEDEAAGGAGPVPGGPMRGIVFLDRDGTLIEEMGYLSDPRAVKEIPGGAESLLRLSGAGFAPAVLSNQSGVALGVFRGEPKG